MDTSDPDYFDIFPKGDGLYISFPNREPPMLVNLGDKNKALVKLADFLVEVDFQSLSMAY